MSTMRFGLAAATILVLTGLSIGAGEAGAAISTRDHMTWNPALAERHPGTIAILPAVSVNGSDQAELWAEMGWALFYRQAETSWMTADDVRAHLAVSGDRSNLLRAARSEIWADGEPRSATARALANALGVDAVLAIRVDRWEIVDGGRAMVELSAALTAADGTRLWTATGLAGHGRSPGSRERCFDADLSWIRPAQLEPGDPENRLGLALCSLFTRWSVGLPVRMTPESTGGPSLVAAD
jgi:hypothetical protein